MNNFAPRLALAAASLVVDRCIGCLHIVACRRGPILRSADLASATVLRAIDQVGIQGVRTEERSRALSSGDVFRPTRRGGHHA